MAPPRDVIAYEMTLVALEDLYIGGDLPDLTRDGPDKVTARIGGRPAVLGTGLAGSLRSRTEVGPRERLFGSEPGARKLTKSAVEVDDFVASAEIEIDVSDGVGIDRRTSAPHRHLKYDTELVPRDTQFSGWVTAPVDTSEGDRRVLEALIGAGATITVGAGHSHGLGRLRVASCTRHLVRSAVSAFDRLFGSCWDTHPITSESPNDAVELRLSGMTPVLSLGARNAGDENASVVDLWPLLGPAGPDGTRPLLIRGTSLRGVLRSTAERVVRSILGDPLMIRLDERGRLEDEDHPAQIDLPLVSALFGAAAHAGRLRPHKGAIRVADLVADHRVQQAHWAQARTAARTLKTQGKHAEDLRLPRAMQQAGWHVRHHVAIDRWTGGAAEHLLYTVLEPPVTTWRTEVVVDEGRLRRNLLADNFELNGTVDDQAAAARNLLALALDELHRGAARVGWGTRRGYGRLAIDGWGPDLARRLAPGPTAGGQTLAAVLRTRGAPG
jgi:CRISPR/Cas system CSM-associated protein Csm3 (group 7 of RAMP superfamily)